MLRKALIRAGKTSPTAGTLGEIKIWMESKEAPSSVAAPKDIKPYFAIDFFIIGHPEIPSAT
jgi:hypothetical protein